jgi:hypothetical protein
MPEFLREALAGTPRIRPVHPGQNDQTCRPLHQGADGRAIPCPLDQIAFPVAGRSAIDVILGIWPRRSAPRA